MGIAFSKKTPAKPKVDSPPKPESPIQEPSFIDNMKQMVGMSKDTTAASPDKRLDSAITGGGYRARGKSPVRRTSPRKYRKSIRSRSPLKKLKARKSLKKVTSPKRRVTRRQ